MTVQLTLEDLLILVDDLGVGPVGDMGLLNSAVVRPATSLWGRDAYAGLDAKAASLLDSSVRNNALVEGNKRLGWLATVVFYGLNGIALDAPDENAYDLVIAIASGTTTEIEDIAAALTTWH